MNKSVIVFIIIFTIFLMILLSVGVWYYNSLEDEKSISPSFVSSTSSSTGGTRKLGTFNVKDITSSSIRIVLDKGTSVGMSSSDRITIKLLPENNGILSSVPETWKDLDNYLVTGTFNKNVVYTLVIETLDVTPKITSRQTFSVL